MCRRWSGGAPFFGVSAKIVRFVDDGTLGRFTSSEWAERGFCTRCGTTLFYFFKPERLHTLSVGTFDDPSVFVIGEEIYVDHKPAGYALAGDHPRLTEREVLAKHGY